MSVHTPQFAPIAVLAFLGTAALLIVSLFAVLIGAFCRSRATVVGALTCGVTIVVGYSAVLLGLAFFSTDIEISQGAWKYFCEIDCHIAYTVGGLQIAQMVGPGIQPVSANERFAIVQLKTWFDPTTISAHRGNGPLTPNGRTIILLDDRGRKFQPSTKSESVLAAARLHSTPLREPLRPGESYVSYVVFEVPSDASGLKLLLTSADEEDFFIWGDENSPMHRKAYFALPRT